LPGDIKKKEQNEKRPLTWIRKEQKGKCRRGAITASYGKDSTLAGRHEGYSKGKSNHRDKNGPNKEVFKATKTPKPFTDRTEEGAAEQPLSIRGNTY